MSAILHGPFGPYLTKLVALDADIGQPYYMLTLTTDAYSADRLQREASDWFASRPFGGVS